MKSSLLLTCPNKSPDKMDSTNKENNNKLAKSVTDFSHIPYTKSPNKKMIF